MVDSFMKQETSQNIFTIKKGFYTQIYRCHHTTKQALVAWSHGGDLDEGWCGGSTTLIVPPAKASTSLLKEGLDERKVKREGNRAADWLANFNLTLNAFDFHVMETPPRELQNILFDDKSDACVPRNVRLDL
ncbi:hypothetical protein MTR_7g105720 [Medicago truncatula]|uniref:Uncharacterized protein n=1 Tax=Medicago truncatula TaxID=3880 RepID=G7ZUW9_MEDTR|nr:hypothetical protein MTR_7g105720 [Medicago truncatula]